MAAVPYCSMCQGQGGFEMFVQQEDKKKTANYGKVKPQQQPQTLNYSIPDALSQDTLPCKKDFSGCMYSAQGALVCNNNKTEQFSTNIPGMGLGGLSTIGSTPIVDRRQLDPR